jgi:hypothetical protein
MKVAACWGGWPARADSVRGWLTQPEFAQMSGYTLGVTGIMSRPGKGSNLPGVRAAFRGANPMSSRFVAFY